MWHCPKCGAEVDDAAAFCWVCGSTSEGTAWNPAEPARPMPPLAQSGQRPQWFHRIFGGSDGDMWGPAAGVTRRFGLDRLMLITTIFAVTFALLRSLGAHWVLYVVIFLFAACVALGQVVLFSGKQPRKASIVAGGVLGPVFSTVIVIIVTGISRDTYSGALFNIVIVSAMVAFPAAFFGALLGYVVGCVVAAAFLKKQAGIDQDESPDEEEFDPLAEVAVEATLVEDKPIP